MAMRANAEKETLGIYVSVPFCRAKCTFCNFASGVGSDAAVERYVGDLVAEIDAARDRAQSLGAVLPERVGTVYFGGGTPSLLTPEQMRRIFSALRGSFTIGSGAEITLEAAPGQIAPELLEAAMCEGVNRVSLGVQSFVDEECSAVGRLHTGAQCLDEILALKAAGIGNVGVDLIAGLPLQTEASWERSLDCTVGAPIEHVSVYMLEVDEDSRLGREVLRGGARFHAPEVASDELSAALYERACERLGQAGFAQYEISNFARAGFVAKHNAKYWTRAPYIGFGLEAHSMLRCASGADVRFANADELVNYQLGVRAAAQGIDEDAAFEEAVFLGLRMVRGVSVEELSEEFGAVRVEPLREAVRAMAEGGLMVEREGQWALTGQGRMVSNAVFAELLTASV